MGALDHPKTLDLCVRLDASLPTTIGHLELLWHWIAQKAPQGNVGKFSNGAIARGASWMGDPEIFVAALTASGFLDPDPAHRLLVHDWAEHVPAWVRLKLSRLKTPFIEPTVERSIEPTVERTLECSSSVASGSVASKVKTVGARAPDRFPEFWSGYPKKVAKGAAQRAWKKASEHADAILADLKSRVWGEARFIPHPATYLNELRWLDERAPVPVGPPAMTDAERASVDRRVQERVEATVRAASEKLRMPK